MGNYYSKQDNVLEEEITTSSNINSILLNNNEMKNKYDRIKKERESYIQRICNLEERFEKLYNVVRNLEINERQNYTKDKRRTKSINHLYNRIVLIETELKDVIVLKAPENNRAFLEPKKK